MPKGRFAKNIVGEKFGRLTVVENLGHDSKMFAIWRCRCECGRETIVRGADLRNGHTKSCGCFVPEKLRSEKTKHGGAYTKLYSIWHSMRGRCKNASDPRYEHYGGRGINVCQEWDNSFESFRDWSYKNGYVEGYSIHRIDNEKGYSPDNCQWLSVSEHNKIHHKMRRNKEV